MLRSGRSYRIGPELDNTHKILQTFQKAQPTASGLPTTVRMGWGVGGVVAGSMKL